MAIVKHVAGKNSSYQAAVDYLTFKSDEHEKLLVDESGFYIQRENCEVIAMNTELDKFAIECSETNEKYGQNKKKADVKSHHYIISYEPDDNMTVEGARKEAVRLYNKFFKGHQGIIAIHADGHNQSGNIHIHIVINSTRAHEMDRNEPWIQKDSDWKEGSKHRCTHKFMYELKSYVMERSKELGLGQVDLLTPARKKVTDREYRAGNGKEKDQLTKDKLREILTSSADKAKDKADFMDKLKHEGVEVAQRGNTITYQFEGKKFRERSLGTDYYMDELQNRMGKVKNEPKKEVKVMAAAPISAEEKYKTMSAEELRFEIENNLITIDRKQKKLDSLGFFQLKERAELQEQIDKLKNKNSKLDEVLESKKSSSLTIRKRIQSGNSLGITAKEKVNNDLLKVREKQKQPIVKQKYADVIKKAEETKAKAIVQKKNSTGTSPEKKKPSAPSGGGDDR